MQPTKDRPDRQSFQLFLPVEMHHRLKILAAELKTSVNALIVAAIEAQKFDRASSDRRSTGASK